MSIRRALRSLAATGVVALTTLSACASRTDATPASPPPPAPPVVHAFRILNQRGFVGGQVWTYLVDVGDPALAPGQRIQVQLDAATRIETTVPAIPAGVDELRVALPISNPTDVSLPPRYLACTFVRSLDDQEVNGYGPGIDGKITTLGEGGAWSVLSVGRVHHVRRDMEFTVYRGNEYVSTVVVVEVHETTSVVRATKGMTKLPIQEGDLCSTIL